ncbi:septal ring lytic transglycosylase RlpA family protein [Roseospira visakhapatnamensis]|uniref:Endolytic peptidoglycan transglycosylase RlpA n=1 Tax=Roseospira visakhapatnamensis TaxID=390880 RepID=A0A7W6W9H2_9PROT|nr:septal ring lytic transglycosylase RlpA family protein [Roseospira visakhapatnamensis]MBB4265818.1 rare lipoprotein A [Roseospira visakhapatnamensis]
MRVHGQCAASFPDPVRVRHRSRALTVLSVGVVLVSLLGLAGCAETTLAVNTAKIIAPDGQQGQSSAGRYKVGSPYQIRGRWYTPAEDMGYDEEGMASWYGPGFHGKSTANGERFDQNALTAAHPTLPMPSMVRVTNMANGRSVNLRVNDRGPFSHNRIIDVSKRAAEMLGFRRRGTARVRVTILEEESLALRHGNRRPATTAVARPVSATRVVRPVATPPVARQAADSARSTAGQAFVIANRPAPARDESRWYVQAGAFSNPLNASRAAEHLESLGPTALSPVTTETGANLLRVRVGPVDTGRQAARLLQVVRSSGYPAARVVTH